MNRLWRTRTFERNRTPKEVLAELGAFLTGLSKADTVQLHSIDTSANKVSITYLVKPTHADLIAEQEVRRRQLAEKQSKIVAEARRALEIAETALHNIMNEPKLP